MKTKYLSHYLEEKQSELFTELGVFFAFSNEQFEEGVIENRDKLEKGQKWLSCGMGMYMPKNNYKEFQKRNAQVIEEAMRQDLAENGLEAIAVREIWNYESFYTMDKQTPWEQVKDYEGMTPEIFKKAWDKEFNMAVDKDLI